ncbi:MAG: hypothetical protein JWP33_1219 [Blastococcus sp.]|nr:hypothetical protein [Blastococcus sp.]
MVGCAGPPASAVPEHPGGSVSVEQDLTAARAAIDALGQACSALTRHFPDTVDSRRLRVDVARLREDLTLLCGTPPRPVHDPYAASFYDDGYDQLMDSPGRRAP